jgi:hypothetical protein
MLTGKYFCPSRNLGVMSIRTTIGLVVVLATVCGGVSAQPRAENMTILAVMDIQDNSGKLKATDVQSASDYLRGLLAQSGRFEVVDKGRQNSKRVEVVKTLKRESYDPCFDDRCRIQLGRAVSADTLLRCTIGAVGTSCMLNCELVILEKETAADAGVQRFTCGPEGLVEAVEKVVPQLCGGDVERGIEERDIGEKAETWSMDVQTGVLVSFESEPAGAVVLVDGRLQCPVTPCSKTLAGGSHKVEIQKESYVPETTIISVGQEMKPVRMTLTPDFGWLTVASSPSGLPVQVDGKQVGTTPLSQYKVSRGPHEVLVSDPRYYDSGKQVQVDRGGTEEIRVELMPREGGLVVNARDDRGNDLAAEVWLDDSKIGTTPLARQLLIGRHRLQVVHGVRQFARDLEIVEKQVQRIDAVLKSGPAGIVRPSKHSKLTSNSSTGTAWGWVTLGTAGAIAGAGVALWISSEGDMDEIKAGKSTSMNQATAMNLEDRANQKQTGAIVSWIAGGVAAFVAAELFARPRKSHDTPNLAWPSFEVLPGGGTVFIGGAF